MDCRRSFSPKPKTIPDAGSFLVTPSDKLARGVRNELELQLASLPPNNPAHTSLRTTGAILLAPSFEAACSFRTRFAPEHLSLPENPSDAAKKDFRRRYHLSRSLGRTASRLVDIWRKQSCSADRRLGPQTRRPLLRRFREMYQHPNHLEERFPALRPFRGNSGRIRRLARAPQRRESPPSLSILPTRQAILDRRTYEPPGEGRADKLRLDFNENTAGCSPAVRRALGKSTPKLLSMYPSTTAACAASRAILRWRPRYFFSTNGGDDGLQAVLGRICRRE